MFDFKSPLTSPVSLIDIYCLLPREPMNHQEYCEKVRAIIDPLGLPSETHWMGYQTNIYAKRDYSGSRIMITGASKNDYLLLTIDLVVNRAIEKREFKLPLNDDKEASMIVAKEIMSVFL